jgi:hypothetical protein
MDVLLLAIFDLSVTAMVSIAAISLSIAARQGFGVGAMMCSGLDVLVLVISDVSVAAMLSPSSISIAQESFL